MVVVGLIDDDDDTALNVLLRIFVLFVSIFSVHLQKKNIYVYLLGIIFVLYTIY